MATKVIIVMIMIRDKMVIMVEMVIMIEMVIMVEIIEEEGRFALCISDPEVFQPISNRLLGEKSNLPYFSIPRGIAVLDCDSHSQAGSTSVAYTVHCAVCIHIGEIQYFCKPV